MNRTAITRLFLFLALTVSLIFAQRVPGGATRPAAKLQPPVQAQPQPRPASAEDKPPVAPQVTCAGGIVTLVAENSTLASVMEAVAGCSGATVDMPATIGANRVFAKIGPTEATHIFAALLDSSLDYVIVGSTRNTTRVHMVVVRPRQAPATGASQQASTAWQSMSAVATQAPAATFVEENGGVPLSSELASQESKMSSEEPAPKSEGMPGEQRVDDGLPRPDPQ